jgi:endo-1,4-beta-D-glucanase Y
VLFPRRPPGHLSVFLLVASALLPGLLQACDRQSGVSRTPAITPEATVSAFLQKYVTHEGRVVRIDQGGDTVSEGQAYAMLMTAVMGYGKAFGAIWRWTETHLQGSDGLLAWHWDHGAVTGEQSAADADLGAAAALVIAADRSRDPGYLAQARRIAGAIESKEVAPSAEGPTLVAGSWALSPVEYVDPSYLAPPEMDRLASAFGAPWRSIAATAALQLEQVTSNGHLPSDWAVIGPDHQIHPSAPPQSSGGPTLFGFDAVRTPLWMATSCDSGLKAAAAGLLPALRRSGGEVELDLGGDPDPGVRSPLGLLAMAAGQYASGDQRAARSLVQVAATSNLAHPTYYASAFLALTVLAFDHLVEGACR